MDKKHPKTSPLYWQSAAFKRTYQYQGETKESGTGYHVRIYAHGERRTVALNTGSQKKAGSIALKLYLAVKANGWDQAICSVLGESPDKVSPITVGQWIEAVENFGQLADGTQRSYFTKFRTVAAGIRGVEMDSKDKKGKSLHKTAGKGREIWKAKVDKIPLAAITDKAVTQWQRAEIRKAEGEEKRQAAANRTNGYIRNASGLFGKKLIPRLQENGVEIPSPIPFSGVKPEIPEHPRFEGIGLDIHKLIADANEELGNAKAAPKTGGKLEMNRAKVDASRRRAAYRVFLLGVMAGLRRDEADKLLWSQVRDGKIDIKATAYFKPKGKSAGKIPIPEELYSLLEKWRKKEEPKSLFVIPEAEPKKKTGHKKKTDPMEKEVRSYHFYRCDKAHRLLIRWLKEKGITRRNPIHALRAEFGSILNEKHGIYNASRMLRHKSVTLTEKFYTDDRVKEPIELGGLLK